MAGLSKPTYEALERALDKFRDDRHDLRVALQRAHDALAGVLEGDFVPTGKTVRAARDLAASTLAAKS